MYIGWLYILACTEGVSVEERVMSVEGKLLVYGLMAHMHTTHMHTFNYVHTQ